MSAVKTGQTSTLEGYILESFLSSLFPNDPLGVLDTNPNIPVPTQSKKTEILVDRDDILLPQIRGDPKINVPCQPIIFRKKAHKSMVLKLNMLSLRGIPHLNGFINNDPVQVTSFSYLGTDGEFFLG